MMYSGLRVKAHETELMEAWLEKENQGEALSRIWASFYVAASQSGLDARLV